MSSQTVFMSNGSECVGAHCPEVWHLKLTQCCAQAASFPAFASGSWGLLSITLAQPLVVIELSTGKYHLKRKFDDSKK